MKEYPYRLYIDLSLMNSEREAFKQFLSLTCKENKNCSLQSDSKQNGSVLLLKEKQMAGDLIKSFQERFNNKLNITYINSKDELILKLSN